MTKYFYIFCVSAAFFIAGIENAAAHHSAAKYEVMKSVEVTGVIQKVAFVNPHTQITLIVKGADGKETQWDIESSSPLMLKRKGWSFDQIKVGETVTIIGAPVKVGENGIYMTGIRLKDGKQYGGKDANLSGLV